MEELTGEESSLVRKSEYEKRVVEVGELLNRVNDSGDLLSSLGYGPDQVEALRGLIRECDRSVHPNQAESGKAKFMRGKDWVRATIAPNGDYLVFGGFRDELYREGKYNFGGVKPDEPHVCLVFLHNPSNEDLSAESLAERTVLNKLRTQTEEDPAMVGGGVGPKVGPVGDDHPLLGMKRETEYSQHEIEGGVGGSRAIVLGFGDRQLQKSRSYALIHLGKIENHDAYGLRWTKRGEFV